MYSLADLLFPLLILINLIFNFITLVSWPFWCFVLPQDNKRLCGYGITVILSVLFIHCKMLGFYPLLGQKGTNRWVNPENLHI